MKKKRIGLSARSGKIPVTLYTREKVKIRPVFIFLAGVNSYYQKRRHINQLAKALAVVGYHSVIVDHAAYTGNKISNPQPQDITELIEAVYQNELFDKERIILAGSDFSSRYLFSLVKDGEMLRKIRCLFFISPVVDVSALRRFAYTGRVKFGQRWIYRRSSANTRLLHLYNLPEKNDLTGKTDKVVDVYQNLLENRRAEAFRMVQTLDQKTRELILAVYRGDMRDEDVRNLNKIENRELEEMFLPAVPRNDIERPVFILQSILDEDVDCGQGRRLFDELASSIGVYLHLTDFITPAGNRVFLSNPALWIKGAFRLAKALYRMLAFVYSDKNYPYNPTKTAIRISD